MKLKELNLEIAKLLSEGYGDADTYVDTEGRDYNYHLVPIIDITQDDGLVDGENHICIIIN
jgi:hypothetical protein